MIILTFPFIQNDIEDFQSAVGGNWEYDKYGTLNTVSTGPSNQNLHDIESKLSKMLFQIMNK